MRPACAVRAAPCCQGVGLWFQPEGVFLELLITHAAPASRPEAARQNAPSQRHGNDAPRPGRHLSDAGRPDPLEDSADAGPRSRNARVRVVSAPRTAPAGGQSPPNAIAVRETGCP